MNKPVFEVLDPGLLTTVQDLGRFGYQQFGVVVSGAMDTFALQVGNILVGNAREEAGLELTLVGPTLRVLQDVTIAIVGADLSPMLDGGAVSLWRSIHVKEGQILQFGRPKKGVYAYIAIAGGIDVPSVMGSKSTYVKARFGGFSGRKLQKGDIIMGGISKHDPVIPPGRQLHPSYVPDYESKQPIRVVLGPDDDYFDQTSIHAFLNDPYIVTNQIDRMGYRLKGTRLMHRQGADIISDAIAPGTIQVPASGEPIILMADRQTTGGYPRIATVISVDLSRVAQMRPGTKLSFQAVSVRHAQQIYIKRERFFRRLNIRSCCV